jgi:hypothetical protein
MRCGQTLQPVLGTASGKENNTVTMMKVPYAPLGGHVARSVEDSPWSFLEKRPLPGVLGFVDEPVAATLAEEEGELFEYLLLEILRIRFLDLLEDSPHLSVHPSLGLGEDAIEVGK